MRFPTRISGSSGRVGAARFAAMAMTAAAIATFTAGTLIVACSGGDGANEANEEGGAGEGGSRLGDAEAPPDDDHHDPLNGVDAGCTIRFAGPRSGKIATSVPRPGSEGRSWEMPQNAREIDSLFAKATLDADQLTQLLRITDFGFEVPPTATVKGAEVQLKRQASDTGIVDGNIQLWLDGVPSSRPKYIATTWPRTIVGTHHYGQAVDTWGDDLTPELVVKPGFGVDIFVKRQEGLGGAALEARIESMRMTIFYCD